MKICVIENYYYKQYWRLKFFQFHAVFGKTNWLNRKASSRMHTDSTITRMSSDRVTMRPIMDRQTPVKTLPYLVVGNNNFSHPPLELVSPPWGNPRSATEQLIRLYSKYCCVVTFGNAICIQFFPKIQRWL